MQRITFEEIGRSTNRLPFGRTELNIAGTTVDERRRHRHDLVIGDMGLAGLASGRDDFEEAAKEGLVIFCSPYQLRTIFLFAKCDAGRGLLGGQKAVFASYIRGLEDKDWQVGPMFKSWVLAATSIGNVYRGVGL